jgi:hypothetical protein
MKEESEFWGKYILKELHMLPYFFIGVASR